MKVGAPPSSALCAHSTPAPASASAGAPPRDPVAGVGRMVSSLEDKRAEMSSFLFPQALKWQLSPLTIVSWLNVYMQVAYLNDMYEVLLPQYPQHVFIQIAEVGAAAWGACPPAPGRPWPAEACGRLLSALSPQLLDLCVLDVGCLEFPYGVLAASALYHFSSSELMQKVSGAPLPGRSRGGRASRCLGA